MIGAWINQDEGNLVFFNISENGDPVAGDDYVTGMPGATIDIPVLANDRDPDGDPIRISEVDASSSRDVEVAIMDNGTPTDFSDDFLRYSVPINFVTGTDRIGYTVEDDQEGSDRGEVIVTLPERNVDLELKGTVSKMMPSVGEVVDITLALTNFSEAQVTAQVLYVLPDGLQFLSAVGDGSYSDPGGFWLVASGAGQTVEVRISAKVEPHGNFAGTALITGVNATETNAADNEVSLSIDPVGLVEVPVGGPRRAAIDGIILSSLTQVSGTISENANFNNAYPIEISLGAGGFGGSSVGGEPFQGFALLSEEEVPVATEDPVDGTDTGGDGTGDGTDTTDTTAPEAEPEPPETELRTTMLILSANSEGVFLNKLFFIREDELQGSAAPQQ